MNELSSRTRAALVAYKTEKELTPEAKRRVWADLQASLERSDPSVGARATSSRLRWTATTVAAAAGVALAVGIGVRMGIGREPIAATLEQAPYQHSSEPPRPLPAPAAAEVEPRQVEPARNSTVTGQPHARSDRPTDPAPVTRDEPEAPAEDRLRQEIGLIAAARQAVAAGDGRRALEVLDEHGRRFPQGQMHEDRAALHIQALCLAGDQAKAMTAARVFLHERSHSVHAELIEAIAHGDPKACSIP